MTPDVEILDTTLRDGAQAEGIAFSAADKRAVVQTLDHLGVAWIEAGNPGSGPKDRAFFDAVRDAARGLPLEHARLCAFGPTRRKDCSAAQDPQIAALIESGADGIVIFGKAWDRQVTEVLHTDLDENLAMIAETVAFVRERAGVDRLGRPLELIFDAEHFFDGYRDNPDYALRAVRAAVEAGASRIVLCDTRGGSFPEQIAAGVRAAAAAASRRPAPVIGIHAHDDMGLACANALAAVDAGCRHVQGTLVGFGERCGNTSLAALIPSLALKRGLTCLPPGRLDRLTAATRAVAEIANVPVPAGLPYVGAHAFAHKAGMHADGILKAAGSFEHVDPALVGNTRHFLMSEAAGRSVIAEGARRVDPAIDRDHPAVAALAARLKALEAEGFQFEGAGASFEILVRKELGRFTPHFTIEAYRVTSEHPAAASFACSHAVVKVLVGTGHEIAAAEGAGPVNALDGALRRALSAFYPELDRVRLTDYKVRVINGSAATAARVRVLIESTDGRRVWTTVGVSEDIIDASRAALVDAIEYRLIGAG